MDCGWTWWEAYYIEEYERLIALVPPPPTLDDEAAAEADAEIYANEQEDAICSGGGDISKITTLREIKGHTETYAIKHTVNFNKKTSADLQLKQKNIGLKGSLTAKDRTKDVDVFTIETGVDTKFGKSSTASLSYSFEKGESSVRNSGVAPDESYRQNKLGLKYSTKLSDPWKLAIDFETADKKYRTANDPDVDKNFGRNDETIKYGINFSYKANDNFNYNLGFKRNKVDRNKLSGTTSTETDTYNFKVEYSF